MDSNISRIIQVLEDQRREWTESKYGMAILNTWANALTPATQETAAEAARQIDGLCPSIDENEQVLEFLWSLWDIMLSIARSPDVTSEIQERLVEIVSELERLDKGTVIVMGQKQKNLWKDLPDLWQSLEAHRSDPTLAIEVEPFTETAAQEWLNFNEFEAKLLEAGSYGAYFDAMLVLQLALEEEPPTAAADGLADCRVMAASIWLSRCAKDFFQWAQENVDPEVTPHEGSHFVAGPLYNGRPYMCPERWEFWQHRLEELGAPDSGLLPQTREAVHRAADAMRTITAGVGSSEAS